MNTTFHQSALLAAILLLSVGCNRPPAFKLTSSGNAASSASFAVSGGGEWVESGHPAVFFGTTKRFAAPRDFTYVIIAKYPNGAEGSWRQTSKGRAQVRIGEAETQHSFGLNGKVLKAMYRIEFDPVKSEVSSEVLEMGGSEVDAAKGRLFLIDFNQADAKPQQVKIELPTADAMDAELPDVDTFVKDLLKKVESHPTVKAFLSPR